VIEGGIPPHFFLRTQKRLDFLNRDKRKLELDGREASLGKSGPASCVLYTLDHSRKLNFFF